jgi:GxxExxY protein
MEYEELTKQIIIVEDTVIIELKSMEQIAKVHEVQLVNYLVATGKPIGLLINFGPDGVTIRRKVRELSLISS